MQGFVFGRTLAVGAIVPPPAAPEQPPGGTIRLSGATVTLLPLGTSTTTTATGAYQFTDVPPGDYTVRVTGPGFFPVQFPLRVPAGQTVLAGPANGQTTLEPSGVAPRRRWTLLVYLDADNDLREFGDLNLNQMELVGSDGNVNLIVQFDGFGTGEGAGARRYAVLRGTDTQSITSPVLQDLGEVNMAQPATMQQFLAWAIVRYPSERLVLIPWNHGAGWRRRSARGILFDDTSEDFMTMAEFRAGMAVPGMHFDLTAMDASLMAMIEVEHEIRELTDLIAASEASPPARGYPYDRILAELAGRPTMTPEDLGRVFVREHIAAYPNEPVTQSLVRTDRLPELGRRVNALGAALLAALPRHRDAIAQARSEAQTYATTSYRDLADFAQNLVALVPDAPVVAAARDVLAGIPAPTGGPVLLNAANLPPVAGSRGLTVYLPAPDQFVAAYANLRFTRDFPQWLAFVRAFAEA